MASDLIAYELAQAGLDARSIDGWVYVALPGGRLLHVGAEYGESLNGSVYASRPAWFDEAPKLARISSQFEESASLVAGLSADVTRLEGVEAELRGYLGDRFDEIQVWREAAIAHQHRAEAAEVRVKELEQQMESGLQQAEDPHLPETQHACPHCGEINTVCDICQSGPLRRARTALRLIGDGLMQPDDGTVAWRLHARLLARDVIALSKELGRVSSGVPGRDSTAEGEAESAESADVREGDQ